MAKRDRAEYMRAYRAKRRNVVFEDTAAEDAWDRLLADPEAKSSLERGLDDARAGRTRPWNEIRAEAQAARDAILRKVNRH